MRQLPLAKLPGSGARRRSGWSRAALLLRGCAPARQRGADRPFRQARGDAGRADLGSRRAAGAAPAGARRSAWETTLASDVLDEAACWEVLSRPIPELELRFAKSRPAEALMGRGSLKFADFHQTTVYRKGSYQATRFHDLL